MYKITFSIVIDIVCLCKCDLYFVQPVVFKPSEPKSAAPQFLEDDRMVVVRQSQALELDISLLVNFWNLSLIHHPTIPHPFIEIDSNKLCHEYHFEQGRSSFQVKVPSMS